MAGKFRTAFFSFPGEPNDLFATIGSAAETAARISDKISIKTWPDMDIFGALLPMKSGTKFAALTFSFAILPTPI